MVGPFLINDSAMAEYKTNGFCEAVVKPYKIPQRANMMGDLLSEHFVYDVLALYIQETYGLGHDL